MGESVTRGHIPGRQEEGLGNSRFCAGKEPFKFPPVSSGRNRGRHPVREEICAFRKRGVPDAGIRPCRKDVLRHYNGSAFTPFCFNDPNPFRCLNQPRFCLRFLLHLAADRRYRVIRKYVRAEATEWVAWILVTIDFMNSAASSSSPKQIRNEYNVPPAVKLVWGGYMPLSYRFLIFPNVLTKAASRWSAVISGFGFQLPASTMAWVSWLAGIYFKANGGQNFGPFQVSVFE